MKEQNKGFPESRDFMAVTIPFRLEPPGLWLLEFDGNLF